MISQYMNGATRVKGWKDIDEQLEHWANDFNTELQRQTKAISEKICNQKASEESMDIGQAQLFVNSYDDSWQVVRDQEECDMSIIPNYWDAGNILYEEESFHQ